MAERTTINANKREEMTCILDKIEVRAAPDGGAPTITGYAAVFDQLSVIMGNWFQYREKIARGAFAGSIATDDVRALWNHNTDFPIGRVKNATLRLWEDANGLGFELTPPATQLAADFVETIRGGYVDGMSFGFSVLEEEWDIDEIGQEIRTLNKIKLFEVSPVTFPAYPQTSAEVRSILRTGDKPDVPERFRRAADGTGNADVARALFALRRRRLDLLSK